jgi:hypothetical protein
VQGRKGLQALSVHLSTEACWDATLHADVQSQLEADSVAVARQFNSGESDALQSLRSAATAVDKDMLGSTWKIEGSELKIRMRNGQPVVLGSGGFGKVLTPHAACSAAR